MFLVSSRMHRYLIRGSKFSALAIAANSPEYRFCSNLMPSVDEKVSILGSLCADVWNSVTPPVPIIPFLAELLIAMCTKKFALVYVISALSMIVAICLPHGANVNGLMVSRLSIGISLSASGTWYNGERWSLQTSAFEMLHCEVDLSWEGCECCPIV